MVDKQHGSSEDSQRCLELQNVLYCSSIKSALTDLDFDTQLFIKNIFIDSKGLAGLWSFTQPFGKTDPPRPMLAML